MEQKLSKIMAETHFDVSAFYLLEIIYKKDNFISKIAHILSHI